MALHHKLVRFDCMIQDQYEEEFFVSYLQSKESGVPGMVYKYFSELTEEDDRLFVTRPDLHNQSEFVQDRGNVLGVSTPNINKWVNSILETGQVSA